MNNKHYSKYFFRALNLLIMVIFIFSNSVLYFFIKEQYSQAGSIINGFILTSSTGFFNFLYTKLLNRVITLENHKYLHVEDDSRLMKLIFFRFLNTNLPILYSIYAYKNIEGTEEEILCA
jgi:hypothetical protein